MNHGWRTTELGEISSRLAPYRPYLLVAIALTLMVSLLPSESGDDDTLTAASPSEPAAASPSGSVAVEGTAETTAVDPAATTDSTAAGNGPAAPGGIGSGVRGALPSESVAPDALAAPDCDPETGRLKIPFRVGPPCVPIFSGPNGGATYQGVTDKTITVVIYVPQSDPQTDATLKAAGVGDTEEERREQWLDWIEYFEDHYEMYGRKIEPVFVTARSAADDDAAGKADAIEIATNIKAFAVWTLVQSPAFLDELAARGVIVFPYYAPSTTTLARLAPYVWAPSAMGASQLLELTAEYVGKKLNNRTADHAGVGSEGQARKFGLLYLDDAQGSSGPEVEAFERHLAKHGARLTSKAGYIYDYGTIQTQARTIMSRFKDAGVTSVILFSDFLSPTFFTKEATNQVYFPEWVLTGSAFTDLNFYGRLYDQSQWTHAFGLSTFGVRYPADKGPCWALYRWHFNRDPVARTSYCVLYLEQYLLFTGIHLAGPNLNPTTFRDALFSLPPRGGSWTGGITGPGVSFGRHGVWDYDDYVAFDDVGEIWWDADERGQDELKNEGTGMYQFVDGGQRIRLGQFTTAASKVFDPNGAVAFIPDAPPQEKGKFYPHEHWRNG